jgi:hypothetical protein|tara:strand:- start:993 stop:1289 length:297 start_codon:yes stop_codon:yes gene_type:complete
MAAMTMLRWLLGLILIGSTYIIYSQFVNPMLNYVNPARENGLWESFRGCKSFTTGIVDPACQTGFGWVDTAFSSLLLAGLIFMTLALVVRGLQERKIV